MYVQMCSSSQQRATTRRLVLKSIVDKSRVFEEDQDVGLTQDEFLATLENIPSLRTLSQGSLHAIVDGHLQDLRNRRSSLLRGINYSKEIENLEAVFSDAMDIPSIPVTCSRSLFNSIYNCCLTLLSRRAKSIDR